MSLADQAIRLAATAYNAVQSDIWTIQSGSLAGTSFQGDGQTEQPFELNTELGLDAREKTVLFVDRPAPALTKGTILSGKGESWRVVGGFDDNPFNDRVKFELVKIVAGKDS